MKAIREIVKAKNNRITIDLGHEFKDQTEYEVIILPVKENKQKLSREDFCGRWKGIIEMSEDFNEPLLCFKEYMK